VHASVPAGRRHSRTRRLRLRQRRGRFGFALANLSGFAAWAALVRLGRVQDHHDDTLRPALRSCIELGPLANRLLPGELLVMDVTLRRPSSHLRQRCGTPTKGRRAWRTPAPRPATSLGLEDLVCWKRLQRRAVHRPPCRSCRPWMQPPSRRARSAWIRGRRSPACLARVRPWSHRPWWEDLRLRRMPHHARLQHHIPGRRRCVQPANQ
jgi:hypothetical protein